MLAEKAQLVGLKNFILNIKPIMDKVHKGEKLSSDENKTIVQFYMETVYVVGQLLAS